MTPTPARRASTCEVLSLSYYVTFLQQFAEFYFTVHRARASQLAQSRARESALARPNAASLAPLLVLARAAASALVAARPCALFANVSCLACADATARARASARSAASARSRSRLRARASGLSRNKLPKQQQQHESSSFASTASSSSTSSAARPPSTSRPPSSALASKPDVSRVDAYDAAIVVVDRVARRASSCAVGPTVGVSSGSRRSGVTRRRSLDSHAVSRAASIAVASLAFLGARRSTAARTRRV